MQTLDVVLQRVYSGEASVAELALDAWTVGVVDLEVALKTVRTIKGLATDGAVESVVEYGRRERKGEGKWGER